MFNELDSITARMGQWKDVDSSHLYVGFVHCYVYIPSSPSERMIAEQNLHLESFKY